MDNPLEKLADKEQKEARETDMPQWLEPMLATLTHDPFDDNSWLYERKLDGERVFTYIDNSGAVSLYSRNRKTLNNSYPEIEKALTRQAPSGCILDGEIVAFNQSGVSDFQQLQPRMQTSVEEDNEQHGIKVYYYLFDCLYLDGYDVTKCSLRSRKKLLKAAVKWQDPLRWMSYRNGSGLEYYRQCCDQNREGVIAKDATASYRHGRSRLWLKFKCVHQQEFVIAGFTRPEGDRIGFGALLLGYYQKDRLVYAGKVGTGFDEQTLENLHSRLKRLERKTSPFDQGLPRTEDANFVTPKLVCEVVFTEWTRDGRLRHPRYKGLRRDKSPGDVVQESSPRQTEKGDQS